MTRFIPFQVCWEWIDAIERIPRVRDSRVVASSQLSIYYAYHTVQRFHPGVATASDLSSAGKDPPKSQSPTDANRHLEKMFGELPVRNRDTKRQ